MTCNGTLTDTIAVPSAICGLWRFEDRLFRDELIRVFVDTLDDPENSQAFLAFKVRLKTPFRQMDIWLTTYPIDVL